MMPKVDARQKDGQTDGQKDSDQSLCCSHEISNDTIQAENFDQSKITL